MYKLVQGKDNKLVFNPGNNIQFYTKTGIVLIILLFLSIGIKEVILEIQANGTFTNECNCLTPLIVSSILFVIFFLVVVLHKDQFLVFTKNPDTFELHTAGRITRKKNIEKTISLEGLKDFEIRKEFRHKKYDHDDGEMWYYYILYFTFIYENQPDVFVEVRYFGNTKEEVERELILRQIQVNKFLVQVKEFYDLPDKQESQLTSVTKEEVELARNEDRYIDLSTVMYFE